MEESGRDLLINIISEFLAETDFSVKTKALCKRDAEELLDRLHPYIDYQDKEYCQ